jgi:NADPH-dependent glutamate synthase beta subunit-like oxidoreductase
VKEQLCSFHRSMQGPCVCSEDEQALVVQRDALVTLWLKAAFPASLQAVIGAGAAGLAAARELVAEGHNVVVFEQVRWIIMMSGAQ